MERNNMSTRPRNPLPRAIHRFGRVPLRGGPRVLLLTSGLGYGHVRAAQGIEAALLQHSILVQSLDLWSLMHPGATSIVHQTYLRLVQEHPELYEYVIEKDHLYPPLTDFKTVVVSGAVANWGDFAREHGTNYRMLKLYNPWLMDSKLTNKAGKTYQIRLPK